MTSHYPDIWNVVTKCCWLRETGATCTIHCQMSLSNITCTMEENSHKPYPNHPPKNNKQQQQQTQQKALCKMYFEIKYWN